MPRLKLLNLCLLVLYPCAWVAPLLRAGFLPLFGMSEISLMTGLQSLWQSDVFLAILVFFFAFFAPYVKTVGLVMVHFNMLSARNIPMIVILGRL
ncbi:MAG: paraquat-inducible protein A, partial [Paracoccaceae bacterium]|nr:paraquat-inducible protein A [Paracoccaceae bacterium]